MAYDKQKLYNQALQVIEKNKLFFIEDVVAYLPCGKQTLYDMFPLSSDEMDTIKDALEKNRTEIKVSMRNKWYKSDNPTLQMGLMKLIGTDEEADRLNGSRIKTDITSKGESLKQAQADLSGLTTEELKSYQAIQSKIENK